VLLANVERSPLKEPDNRGPNEITSAIPEQMFARARAPRITPLANNATPSINSFNRGECARVKKEGAEGGEGKEGGNEK